MKVLFAGPTIHKLDLMLDDIELRAPASHGDVTRAVLDGAMAIGLIDGQFEAVAAVWHKELLFALSRGVQVLGAASMGALRSAECEHFGMKPIGVIANRYADGSLDDDAAVAQVHGPAELGFIPMSETLVDAVANIEQLRTLGIISDQEENALINSARSIFFKIRTAQTIVEGARSIVGKRHSEVLTAYTKHHFSLKARDALQLIDQLRRMPVDSQAVIPQWKLSEPETWKRAQVSISAAHN